MEKSYGLKIYLALIFKAKTNLNYEFMPTLECL